MQRSGSGGTASLAGDRRWVPISRHTARQPAAVFGFGEAHRHTAGNGTMPDLADSGAVDSLLPLPRIPPRAAVPVLRPLRLWSFRCKTVTAQRSAPTLRPRRELLEWHGREVFRGRPAAHNPSSRQSRKCLHTKALLTGQRIFDDFLKMPPLPTCRGWLFSAS